MGIPGGKLEAGETPDQAVVRELREEFGIETECIIALGKTAWQDAHGAFEMHVILMRHVSGEVIAREHKAVQWVSLDQLPPVDLAPVDVAVIPMLRQLQS